MSANFENALNVRVVKNGRYNKVVEVYETINGVWERVYELCNFKELLKDFEYVENNNETATITGWKQTLNGVSSTKMVIPNNSKVKLE